MRVEGGGSAGTDALADHKGLCSSRQNLDMRCGQVVPAGVK